jgi:hypothetical protein
MLFTPKSFEPRDLVPKIFSSFEILLEKGLPDIPFVEASEPSWYTDYEAIEWK